MCEPRQEYDSDDEEEAAVQDTSSGGLDDEYSEALQTATAGDIQDIADILGVTFQEHCQANIG